VNVFSTDDGLAILLTYGPNRDWVKNLTAAHGGQIKHHGRTFAVKNPRVVTKAEAAPSVRPLWRPLYSILPFEKALLLTRAT
jgi:deazaflavin-dependent oxidoreductase (nitroreductase family)